MLEITVQSGGWPRKYVAWASNEAGQSPPTRDWRATGLDDCLRLALAGLGVGVGGSGAGHRRPE